MNKLKFSDRIYYNSNWDNQNSNWYDQNIKWSIALMIQLKEKNNRLFKVDNDFSLGFCEMFSSLKE